MTVRFLGAAFFAAAFLAAAFLAAAFLAGAFLVARLIGVGAVAGRFDAGGIGEHGDLGDVEVDHVPEIGDQLAAGDQPELELVEVAVHRDVEAHALGDRRHRDVRAHPRALHVERLARSRDVGDDHVDRRIDAIGQLEPAGQPGRRGGHDR